MHVCVVKMIHKLHEDVQVYITGGRSEGSRCLPKNDKSRLHMSPLPKNMKPVTSQKAQGSCGKHRHANIGGGNQHSHWVVLAAKCLTSSKAVVKFIPKATPISPNRVREKEPIVSCRFRRIITLRWLQKTRQHVSLLQRNLKRFHSTCFKCKKEHHKLLQQF